jgi:hypothetical protein
LQAYSWLLSLFSENLALVLRQPAVVPQAGSHTVIVASRSGFEFFLTQSKEIDMTLIRSITLAAATLMVASGALAEDASGKWKAMIPGDGPGGQIELVYNLTAGAKGTLAGTVGSERFGASPIKEGRITENKLSFVVEWSTPKGDPLAVRYSGAVKGEQLELTAVYTKGPLVGTPAGKFTATAKRQK